MHIQEGLDEGRAFSTGSKKTRTKQKQRRNAGRKEERKAIYTVASANKTTCMEINVSVQYNGGLLPEIILSTRCSYIGEPF